MDSNQEETNIEQVPCFSDDDDAFDVLPYVCFDEKDGIDRLSDLPDYVLSKILCFMPTKNAMAAKILSTRWGRLFPVFWIPPIVIDLNETSYVHYLCGRRTGPNSQLNFEKFADRLLHETLINVPSIDVLNLNLKPVRYKDEKVLDWINAALRLNVRELSYCRYQSESQLLFDIINGNMGLERLEFHGVSDLDFPNDFTLPNLKTLVISSAGSGLILCLCVGDGVSLPNLMTLVLTKVDIYSSDVMEFNKLTKSCLALEVLSFKQCHMSVSEESSFCLLSIQCPSLKKLTIEDCNGIWECSVAIDAPKLQLLLCKGFAAASYSISSPFNSLLSAHIDVEFTYSADGVEELVAACSSAVDLYLCALLMDALHLTRAQLPMLVNLNRLALGYIQHSGWAMLARLLHNSPNLEKLTFKEGFCLQDGGYSSFESLMTNIPPCLELHVKEIKFLVFDEKEDEIKLVEYFTNNGKAIETLELPCLPFKRKSTRERLAVLPRQSMLVFQPR